MPFKFKSLEIEDVVLIEPNMFPDDRGFFLESFKQSEFKKFGIDENFVQGNHSRSSKGVLRGLHYQKKPQAQAKLIKVFCGEIFDVAVDIRKGSPTFGKWIGEILSAENHCMLFIPPGFAHGFCVLSESADIFYQVTAEYAPEHDRGILWNDPVINIQWRIDNPILSPKDANLPALSDADNNFVF